MFVGVFRVMLHLEGEKVVSGRANVTEQSRKVSFVYFWSTRVRSLFC